MVAEGTETRDDVMNTLSLHTLLCEKTAAEYRARWEQRHPRPPLAGMVLTTMLAIILWGFRLPSAACVFLALTALQGILSLWGVVANVLGKAAEVQQQILRGEFPADSGAHVLTRLRWWSHLIVPHRWARHSRIYDRKQQLAAKVEASEARIRELQAESSESEEKRKSLSSSEVMSLAAQIGNLADRIKYDARIAAIREEMPRVVEELRLYSALYHKVLEVTERLDRIEKLSQIPKGFDQAEISGEVLKFCEALEERRRLVNLVDQIDPEIFLEMVKV